MSFSPGDDTFMPREGNIESATITIETTDASSTKNVKKFRFYLLKT